MERPEIVYEYAEAGQTLSLTGDVANSISTASMTRPVIEYGSHGTNDDRIPFFWKLITPMGSGQTNVNAGGGDDLINASSGSDVYDGGDGFDIVNFDFDPFPTYAAWEFELPFPKTFTTVDLAAGTATWTGRDVTEERSAFIWGDSDGDGDNEIIGTEFYSFPIPDWGSYTHRLTNIEAIRDTEGDDFLYGSDAPLEMFDLSGGGEDRVDGREGADWVSYNMRSTLILEDDTYFLKVDLSKDLAITRDYYYPNFVVQRSTLANIENVLGTGSKDEIIGGEEANTINGGGGNDELDGGDGIDTLQLEIDFSAAWNIFFQQDWATRNSWRTNFDPDEGNVVDLAAGTSRAGLYDSMTVKNFENVTGTSRNDTITGDAGANRLEGWDGDDVIMGGDGDDYLIGGRGDDTLTGGEGKDTFAMSLDGSQEGTAITDFTFGTDGIDFI